MTKIDIATVLSPILRNRHSVHELYARFQAAGEGVTADFANVQFATRSFIDEFYNVFLKDKNKLPFSFNVVNMPSDLKATLDSVGRTQTSITTVKPTIEVKQCDNIDELLSYMNLISF